MVTSFGLSGELGLHTLAQKFLEGLLGELSSVWVDYIKLISNDFLQQQKRIICWGDEDTKLLNIICWSNFSCTVDMLIVNDQIILWFFQSGSLQKHMTADRPVNPQSWWANWQIKALARGVGGSIQGPCPSFNEKRTWDIKTTWGNIKQTHVCLCWDP